MEMSIDEAIRRINQHNEIHQRKEPRAIYITEAFDTLVGVARKYQMMQADYKTGIVAMLKGIKNDLAKLKSYESADGMDLVMLADIGEYFNRKISELEGANADRQKDT